MCETINTKHHRMCGMYAREMELPKGWKASSHKHVFDHMSILSKGTVIVTVDGVESKYVAPTTVMIAKEKTHSIEALEDVVWFCIHTDENYKIEEIKIKKGA